MTDDRPYIELKFTGTTLTQSSNASNPLGGTNIVIDYGDGNIEQYNGDFSHTYDTNGVYTIQIYGVTTIKNYCFYQCFGLTSVSIPNSVTSLGESCFSGCSDLISVSIPNSITNLTYSCFYNCSSLNDISIPDSVTYIGPNCFYKCSSLTSVSIPNLVTYIGNYCFMRCSNLINISIANSVTYIGGNVFQYCSNLTNIELNWTSLNDIITYEATWIRNTNDNLVFTVPQETNSLYIEKGYPSAQVKNKPSYILFTDVKKMLLNNNEVESIVVDEVDGRVLYQKPHTEILLSTSNNTISYGETVTLNGTATGLNSGTIKLYQNNTLIDTLTIGSNGSFTKTISNLNVGTYTYKAVYDGDTTHNDGKSNEIIVKVNKVKPVLTISCDKNVIHPNEIITLTGTTTVDETVILKYYEGYDVSKSYQLATIESNNGTFTYTFTNTFTNITNIKIYAMINPSANSNVSFSPTITLTNTKYFTNLAIEVPTLVYSDIFDVTGILTDKNNNPINNASVKLYRDGNILEATETTNNNGEVTFHRNAPTNITTYTFQLQYDGDNYYNSSNSSVATRTVTKETSILNLTSPLDNSNYSNNELITVNGNLSDNDATPLANKNIIINSGEREHFYINNNSINGSNLDTNLTYVLAYDVSGDGDELYDYITETHQYNGGTYHIYSTESTQNDINNAILSNGVFLLSKIEEYGGISFTYLGEISETNTEFTVENILTTFTTDSNGDFTGTINSNLLNTGENSLTFNFVEEAYYTGATQSITINIGEETIPIPSSLTLNASKTILSSADAFKNWTHPYIMGIDEENGLPYLTATGSGVVLSNLTLPNEFEINYKFKTTNNTTSGNALLFNIGADVNNGILIGNEGTSRQMHIYTRVNNSNSGVAIQQNVYNYQEWTDVNIRYEDNIISITMNGETISYTLTNPDLIQNYLAVYGTGVPNTRFTNFEIIDLSDDSIVYSSSENTSTKITATVLDENDSPIENETVTFNIGLHEIQRITNSNGVATLDYTPKQLGDVTVNATLNNLSDSIIIEDCLFYNDGSDITNLRKQSNNINLSTNGEWLTISKSNSGEECVYLPAPLCCFTGTDNWEMSVKCKPSDYDSQALAIEVYGCNYGSYSGDSQYFGYGDGGNRFYGYLPGNYTLLDTDKVTYRRENGYWKVYVNDNTLITSKSYNWSGNRQIGLYSNSGRRQNVKELKIKKNIPISNISLSSDVTRVNIDELEQAILTATLTSLNLPIENKTITFKENNVVIGTATTNNNGVATFYYNPIDYGDHIITAEYDTLYDSISIYANNGSNIIYYNSGADLSKVSDFDLNGVWTSKNSSNGTYTVSSDGSEWITITRSGGGNYGHIPIAPLTGINVPFKLSVIVEMIAYGDPYNASYSGLYALNKSTNYSFLCQWGYPFRMCRSDKGSSDNWSAWNSGGNVSNATYKYEVVFKASRVTHNLYDLNNNLLKTYNTTTSLNHTTATAEFGIHTDTGRNFRIKEIIAERLD